MAAFAGTTASAAVLLVVSAMFLGDVSPFPRNQYTTRQLSEDGKRVRTLTSPDGEANPVHPTETFHVTSTYDDDDGNAAGSESVENSANIRVNKRTLETANNRVSEAIHTEDTQDFHTSHRSFPYSSASTAPSLSSSTSPSVASVLEAYSIAPTTILLDYHSLISSSIPPSTSASKPISNASSARSVSQRPSKGAEIQKKPQHFHNLLQGGDASSLRSGSLQLVESRRSAPDEIVGQSFIGVGPATASLPISSPKLELHPLTDGTLSMPVQDKEKRVTLKYEKKDAGKETQTTDEWYPLDKSHRKGKQNELDIAKATSSLQENAHGQTATTVVRQPWKLYSAKIDQGNDATASLPLVEQQQQLEEQQERQQQQQQSLRNSDSTTDTANADRQQTELYSGTATSEVPESTEEDTANRNANDATAAAVSLTGTSSSASTEAEELDTFYTESPERQRGEEDEDDMLMTFPSASDPLSVDDSAAPQFLSASSSSMVELLGYANMSDVSALFAMNGSSLGADDSDSNDTNNSAGSTWPVKMAAVVEGDLVLGGLMMVHEREDSVTCGPVMPQGGVQALEAMLYTMDRLNAHPSILPNVSLGAHILDDCDKDTYGLEMAVDFIKDVDVVTLSANVNKPITSGATEGDISFIMLDASETGRFVHIDENVQLKSGDVINYTGYLNKADKGYGVDGHFIVNRLVQDSITGHHYHSCGPNVHHLHPTYQGKHEIHRTGDLLPSDLITGRTNSKQR